jgi:hypothetical protein
MGPLKHRRERKRLHYRTPEVDREINAMLQDYDAYGVSPSYEMLMGMTSDERKAFERIVAGERPGQRAGRR